MQQHKFDFSLVKLYITLENKVRGNYGLKRTFHPQI